MNNSTSSSNSGSKDGCIVNRTYIKLILPNDLGQTYCREFLDDDCHCNYGKKCSFNHAVIPKEFNNSELSAINKWAKDTEDIYFKKISNTKSKQRSSVNNRR